ncbi:conserved exported hypothetical protein [uncultured Paludibacter sp.]|uniref:Lipoprotein n=1 Tax=uncultured Paludibacter sp. TaxID=497635 RepID=A0A653ACB8_9BACT|nr:conserved exported hypothetical protein [uncultured Paludibacter sp.]
MKKLFFNLLVISTALLSLNFVSCKNDSDPQKDSVDILIEQGVLTGKLDHAVTLDASVTYKLNGTFSVENGASLTIPAGTTIKASEGYGSYIIVAQGGKIFVNGTASQPVIMTADNEASASAGYWGGLILNGKAKISGQTGITATGTCEMNPDYTYGGSDDADNSGSITYLEIKYGGARSSAEVEHNGLTLDAVGSGTTIHDIYVYENADDGIEFFGGTVNVSNLLIVNPDDDMFDNTQGYRGTLTNCYGIWESGYTSTESDPRGVESDGNLDGLTPTDVNQTDFTITNMTIDLKLAYNAATQATYMQDIIKIRRGAKATITNALVKGTGAIQDLIDMSDSKGAGTVDSSISLTNGLTIPTSITGHEVTPGYITNTDGTKTYLTYPNVSAIATGNTGCDTSIFAWTGYTGF